MSQVNSNFNTQYIIAKQFIAKSMLDNDIFVFPRYNPNRDDLYENHIITYPDLVASIAANIPGAGVTSVTLNNFNPLFTVANTGTVTDPIFTFTAVPQNANLVYAGPAAGPAAAPTFRALTLADMPAGIDAQNLANVLSVGNTTNELLMTSNNGFSKLALLDVLGALQYNDTVSNSVFYTAVDNATMELDGPWGGAQIYMQPTETYYYHLVKHRFDSALFEANISGDITLTSSIGLISFDSALAYRFVQLTANTATYINASNDLVSIAPTTDGDVFTLVGGIPTWAPLPGSSLATCLLDFYVTNINSCSPLNINASNGQDIYMVAGGGNVGIGITAPTAKLHIVGDTGMWIASPSGGYGKIQIIPYSPSQLYASLVDSDNTELRMSGGFGANAGKWRITNTANNVRLGINKTNADATLDVVAEGSGYSTAFQIKNSSANVNLLMFDNNELYFDYGAAGQTTKHSSGRWDFANTVTIGGPTNTGIERFQIKGSGNTSSTYAVDVLSSGGSSNFRVKDNGTVAMISLQTGNAGLASGDLYVDTAANILANGDLIIGRKV